MRRPFGTRASAIEYCAEGFSAAYAKIPDSHYPLTGASFRKSPDGTARALALLSTPRRSQAAKGGTLAHRELNAAGGYHLFSMPSLPSLRELLIEQLEDLYSAEQQLVEALPKMADAATGENLKQGFLDHLEQTQVHVERLEKAFAKLGVTPAEKTCVAMQGLVAEGEEAIELEGNGALRDVALVGAARRVEHYEIAAYKAVRGIAGAVDEGTVADLLQQTLDEECDTDKRLCALGDLGLEAAKDVTGDEERPAAKATPGKLGKKKHR